MAHNVQRGLYTQIIRLRLRRDCDCNAASDQSESPGIVKLAAPSLHANYFIHIQTFSHRCGGETTNWQNLSRKKHGKVARMQLAFKFLCNGNRYTINWARSAKRTMHTFPKQAIATWNREIDRRNGKLAKTMHDVRFFAHKSGKKVNATVFYGMQFRWNVPLSCSVFSTTIYHYHQHTETRLLAWLSSFLPSSFSLRSGQRGEHDRGQCERTTMAMCRMFLISWARLALYSRSLFTLSFICGVALSYLLPMFFVPFKHYHCVCSAFKWLRCLSTTPSHTNQRNAFERNQGSNNEITAP